MYPIETRCQRRDTSAFVAPETLDLLAEKMIGIVADRRMTKMHRYLGDNAGTPRLYPGLRVWTGGYSGPTTHRAGEFASINLASQGRPFESIGFSIYMADETEQNVRDRYSHPEQQWLGQRRDITLVELNGCPGGPGRDDQIRIEYWNSNGVGQETIVVFDDLDPVQEIAWDLKGDTERQVHLWDEFCAAHNVHQEHPAHAHSGCELRQATLAENLRMLADLATEKEGN